MHGRTAAASRGNDRTTHHDPHQPTTWRGRNVIALGIVSFLTDIHSEAILALLPQFMASVLGLSMSAIGAIEGVAEAGASLLKIASGWLSDKTGKRKPVVIVGYALSTVVKPLLAVASRGLHVLAVRIGDRIGKGIRTSARDALLADSVAPEHRGRAYGFHRAMDTAGAIVGTALAFLLLKVFGLEYRAIFLLATVAGVLAVAALVVGVREVPPKPKDESAAKKPAQRLAGSWTGFLVAHGIFSAGNFSYAFFMLRAKDVGFDEGWLPGLYLFHNVVYALAAFPAGRLLDRIGPRRAQPLSYLAQMLPCLGMALWATPATMLVWFALYGIQLGATGACTRATAAGLIPEGRRGAGMGIFHAVEGGGLFIAGVVGGQIWDRLDSGEVAFLTGATLALIAAILVRFALRPGQAENAGSGQEDD